MPRSTGSRLTRRRSRKASRATRRPISPAIAPKGRARWSSGRRESWDALLGWARRRFDVDFAHDRRDHARRPARRRRSSGWPCGRRARPFRLAGLSPLVTIGGSLVAALAVLEGASRPIRPGTRSASTSAGSSSNGARMPRPKPRSTTAAATSWPRRGSWSCSKLSGRADEVSDESQEIGSGARGADVRRRRSPEPRPGIVHVVVDQDIIIFGPVADLAGRAAHAVGDDLFAVGAALVQAGAPAPPSKAEG